MNSTCIKNVKRSFWKHWEISWRSARNKTSLCRSKSAFYAKYIKWCRRVIDKNSFKLYPKNLEALKTILFSIAAKKNQFVNCCEWMAAYIPNSNKRFHSLNKSLEASYELAEKRKKSALKKLWLSKVSWGPRHELSFKDLQEALKNAVNISFPKDGMATCVLNDASKILWAGLVTQIDSNELGKEPSERDHQSYLFSVEIFQKRN